jgi:serine/threonine protein kinase
MADLFDRLKNGLADCYAIERELGRGGMSVVFLARDLKHGRKVAVKALLPDLAAALGSDRFLREIRVTANLQHPHILQLYDSGEVDELLYYVMPYIEGESLRQRLNRVPPPEIDEVLHVTGQVASALDYAHRQGVLHRDIKPENILLSDGHAIVADFGIAKAISTAGGDNLTRSGFPLGTPGYMSPEQAASVVSLDPTTDVYSLTCVVYEMLIGDTPGEWPTEETVRMGRFVDAFSEHRERLDTLPGRLEQILVQGLATQRKDRTSNPLLLYEALTVAADRSPRLGEAEAREVMRRAAELDADQPSGETALSIGAIEQVAAEVGIPPERVREAVEELNRQSDSATVDGATQVPKFFGVPTTLVVERTIPGVVPATEYPLLVKEIHARLGMVGHTSTLGNSLTWSPAEPGGAGRSTQVTVTSAGGHTSIRIRERLDLVGDKKIIPYLTAIGGGIVASLVGGAMGLADSALIVIPAALGGVLGFNVAARFLYMTVSSRYKPQLESLGDRLVALGKNTARLREPNSSPPHRRTVP